MELPARIGKYELQELLGGGMSRVYRARDTVLGRTVVLKILTEQATREPEAKARFLREAQVAGNLAHDNVIAVYDFGEESGRPYMVMEFLRGEDLRSLIKSNRCGDLHCRIRIALQLARALEYIHAHKIIHRDIKPDNIQVTSAGVVKLMDFGIARTQDTQLTRPGFTLGTPYYMAPEQVRGLQVTPLVDIYSFGVLLFELLTGARPIEGDTIERIFYEILYKPLDLKPLEGSNAPPQVANLVARSTSKDPAGRPQSFAEVCTELERVLRRLERPSEAEKAPEPPPPPPEPAPSGASFSLRRASARPARKTIALAAAAVVCLTAINLYLWKGPSSNLAPVLATPTGEMMLVPAGPFLSGGDNQRVTLPAFYIDKNEVANAAYARFCAEKKRPLPEDFSKDRPDYPVVNVSLDDAREFAWWAGKRLPTALEWEKAARGTDGRVYPWGRQRDPSRANVRDNPARGEPDLMPANSLLPGASPYQAVNMLGNVWEFVDERRTPTPGTIKAFAGLLKPTPTASEPWYGIRGGSYDLPLLDNGTWDSGTVPARHRAYNIGFRCARDAR